MFSRVAQENIEEYASDLAAVKEKPTGTDYTVGVNVGRTIPAKWWNWLFSALTKRVIEARKDTLDIAMEIQNAITDSAIELNDSDNKQLSKSMDYKAQKALNAYIASKGGIGNSWEASMATRTANAVALDVSPVASYDTVTYPSGVSSTSEKFSNTKVGGKVALRSALMTGGNSCLLYTRNNYIFEKCNITAQTGITNFGNSLSDVDIIFNNTTGKYICMCSGADYLYPEATLAVGNSLDGVNWEFKSLFKYNINDVLGNRSSPVLSITNNIQYFLNYYSDDDWQTYHEISELPKHFIYSCAYFNNKYVICTADKSDNIYFYVSPNGKDSWTLKKTITTQLSTGYHAVGYRRVYTFNNKLFFSFAQGANGCIQTQDAETFDYVYTDESATTVLTNLYVSEDNSVIYNTGSYNTSGYVSTDGNTWQVVDIYSAGGTGSTIMYKVQDYYVLGRAYSSDLIHWSKALVDSSTAIDLGKISMSPFATDNNVFMYVGIKDATGWFKATFTATTKQLDVYKFLRDQNNGIFIYGADALKSSSSPYVFDLSTGKSSMPYDGTYNKSYYEIIKSNGAAIKTAGDYDFIVVKYSGGIGAAVKSAFYRRTGEVSWRCINDMDSYLTDVCYNNGTYVLTSSYKVYSTTDPITETVTVTHSSDDRTYDNGFSVYLFNNYFVIRSSHAVLKSTDGITWETVMSLSATTDKFDEIAFSSTRLVLSATVTKSYTHKIYYTDDLITWRETQGVLPGNDYKLMYYTNSLFICVTSTGRLAYSYEGVIWHDSNLTSTQINYNGKHTCYFLYALNTYFFIANNLILYAPEATDWHKSECEAHFNCVICPGGVPNIFAWYDTAAVTQGTQFIPVIAGINFVSGHKLYLR